MRRFVVEMVALWPLWVALALLACGGAVPRGAPPDDELPACFRFVYSDKADRLHTAQACFERDAICTEALGLVLKYGRFGNVEQVGECEQW